MSLHVAARLIPSLFFCLGLALASAAAGSGAPSLGLHVAPCTQGRTNVPAACGTFGVYEDRAARTGRIISLRVVVLKAKHPTQRAIAWIPGGPGQSAVALVPLISDGMFSKELSALRDDYNLLFVESRGMGESHAFGCDFMPAGSPRTYFERLFPSALVAACRAKNVSRSDPNFYHTSNAVDDLNEVRASLGYPKLVLDGGSYGTFFSFVFIRRHPAHVESAVLTGVFAPHFQPLPGSADGAQTAFDDLARKCRNDAVCNTHFPAFRQHFSALLQRFDSGPIPLSVRSSKTKHFETVRLSKEVFVDRLRQILYDPDNAASIPYIVERAFHADYGPLGESIEGMSQAFAGALDWGAFLSYTCADEMPFISEAKVKTVAAHSFAGDLRFRAQQRACAIWNVPPMPPSFDAPVRSNIPILMISGSDDPTTPPRYAARALPYLPNARQAVVQGAGHTTETPCTDRLMVEFVRAGSAHGLDLSRCRRAFAPPPFATR